MLLIGLLVGIAYAVGGFAKPVDAVVYWQSGTSTNLYPQYWSECCEGYLFYPPPVAQVSTLLQPFGWQLFIIVLTIGIFASIWFCARDWSLALIAVGVPYYLGVGPDMPATFLSYALLGNLQWVLAALTVAAFEHPSAYPLLVLTKGSTGIGLLWLVVRREWKAALIGVGMTVAVVTVSFLWAPHLWFDFVGFAIRNASMANPPMPMFPVPFGIRVTVSVLLLVWGALTDRRWVVPIASGFAIPALWGFGFLPFVVAATRLAGPSNRG
jgi:hypothetical protein